MFSIAEQLWKSRPRPGSGAVTAFIFRLERTYPDGTKSGAVIYLINVWWN